MSGGFNNLQLKIDNRAKIILKFEKIRKKEDDRKFRGIFGHILLQFKDFLIEKHNQGT